jgi:hypothetical protein
MPALDSGAVFPKLPLEVGKVMVSLTSTAEELELPNEVMVVSTTVDGKVLVSLVSVAEGLEIPGESMVVAAEVDEKV